MSLINKMLQDLDARRVPGNGSAEPTIKLMARPRARSASTVVTSITAVVAAAVLIAGGYAAWRFYQRPAPKPVAPSVTFTNLAAKPVPAAVAAPAVVATPVSVTPPPEPVADAPERPVPDLREEAVKPQAMQEDVTPVQAAPKPRAASRSEPKAAKVPAQVVGAATAAQGRSMSAQQQAEANYRRATAALQEGRIREAISLLEEALVFEPRHDAARQTLVGLLLEAKRSEDAMRVLQNGLVLDPRQPAMAMLLARLQIEHGATGIETLMRSLPYAAGDADYQGFLAGALQRALRHREAIEQYQAAVRSSPGNGVWWMGLGISLQAEKRAPEAADAYSRALATGTLSPDLRSFVERRLDQSRR